MRERYIPAFIMLIAATITSITNILSNIDLFTGLRRLLLVIIIFYIIGLIAKTIIIKAFTSKKEEAGTTEEPEGVQETPEDNEKVDNKQNTVSKEDEAKK